MIKAILVHRLSRLFSGFGWGLILIIGTFTSQGYGQEPPADDLFSISFPSEGEGWACGRWGTIVCSSNGGATWKRQNSGTDYTLSAIFFTDNQNGWAVGDQGTVLHTKDGGKNWIFQKSPVPFYLMDVYFVNPLKGFIVTERTHIISTDDGGDTWNINFRDEDFILSAISFSDNLNGWAVGEYGYVYHTSDGGMTWKKQAGLFDFSEETGDPIGDPFLFDVVGVDAKTAWAVGIDGYVIRTIDGGMSWQKVATGGPVTQLFGIAGRGKELLIVGRGTVMVSRNNGENWDRLEFDPLLNYGWLYGAMHIGDGRFAMAGWEGRIYSNVTATWKKAQYLK